MTYTDDPRARFVLADFFRDAADAGKVARQLYYSKSGFSTVGDVQRRPLRELREAMKALSVPEDLQAKFLAQLGRSSVLSADVHSLSEMSL